MATATRPTVTQDPFANPASPTGAPLLGPPTVMGADRPGGAWAGLVEMDGRTVAFFEVGGRAVSSTGRDPVAEADAVAGIMACAGELGVPVIGVVESLIVHPDELAGLVAWGGVARATTTLSGVVPLLLAVTGPCHGGLATMLGLADQVVMTTDASSYVNGPSAVRTLTAVDVDGTELGGAGTHSSATGLASMLAADRDDAVEALADLLSFLPSSWDQPPPIAATQDPAGRPCRRAASVVPSRARTSYDVRDVLDDIADAGSVVEVRADHAPNLVTSFARVGGRPVAVVANQPAVRAGTLDIAASSKAARHVQAADGAGMTILTLVDTPGFEPGKDLEWRGMIRHGAELVHAYSAATVPRVCVVLRKAYGGAYIVMDSRSIGSDLVLAWPSAEIAVMGAPGAVAILHHREIAAAENPEAARAAREAEYQTRFCTPRLAAARGYVDKVIDPITTRAHVAGALARLAGKRQSLPRRRHSNTPC